MTYKRLGILALSASSPSLLLLRLTVTLLWPLAYLLFT